MLIPATLFGLTGSFFYLYFLTFAAIYCNIALAYALSMCFSSVWLCKRIFTGIILPLQVLMSGFLVSIPTMQQWSYWGSAINPLTYYLAGALRNECSGNSDCTGDLDYHNIEEHYGYTTDLVASVFVIAAMAIVYKCFHIALLYIEEKYRRKGVKRKLKGWRRKVNKIVQAGLRWRDSLASSQNPSNRFDDDAMPEFEFN